MQQVTHSQTPPEDRVPIPARLVYGVGAIVNNLLAAAIGGLSIVLNLGLGMSPALVGIASALPRLLDAFIDPVMGYVSDHTRSRWGRRRPYIFVGAIASGLVFMLLWQMPRGESESFYFWYYLCGSMLFYVAYTIFAAPWVALGFELTPDYNERSRVMGVQSFLGQFAYLLSPWFLWIMQERRWFDDLLEGAAGLSIAIGLLVIGLGVLPAIFLRERYAAIARAEESARPPGGMIRGFFAEFAITLRFEPFQKLCLATFMIFNGFMLVAAFQSYVIIFYIFGGDQSLGAQYAGWSGTLSAICTFCVITIVTWLATRVGKRRAFFISTGISVVGHALKWFCYDPSYPLLLLLPVPLIAFGLGGLFPLMGSMLADICDLDEVQTQERREGMFGAVFWWVVKLGMAAALAAGGFLLDATGFDVALGAVQPQSALMMMRLCDVLIPLLGSLVGIWAIATCSLTEQSAREARTVLEARRGKTA